MHHIVLQKLSLVDGPASPDADLEQSGSSTHLPLPSAFKAALKGLRSSDNLAQDAKDEDSGLVVLTNTMDIGILPLGGPLRALRVLNSGALSLALAWSSDELSVCAYLPLKFGFY